MNALRIGSIGVDRVEEKGRLQVLPLSTFLPGVSAAEAVSRYPWLVPNHFDAASQKLLVAMQTWVIRTPHHVVLVDTCSGNHRERPTFPPSHQLNTPFMDRFRALGVKPDEVDFVMCTHLHVDHVGWNTQNVDGRWVPTFSNAKYLLSRLDFENAAARDAANAKVPVDHGAFRDSVLPIMDAGLAQLVDGEHEITEGLRLKPAPGHTCGHCMLQASSKGHHGFAPVFVDAWE